MKRANYILTIMRNKNYETFITQDTSLIMFLLIEKELGHDTHILSAIEITKEEYDYYQQRIK